jgi:hypothetical protein
MRKHTILWMAAVGFSLSLLGCGSGTKVVEATNKITAIETANNQPPYGGPSKGEMGKGSSGGAAGGGGGSGSGPGSGGPPAGGPVRK